MASRLWTDEEVQYLRLHIEKDGIQKVAEFLNWTYGSVMKKAYTIGLRGLHSSEKKRKADNERRRKKYRERQEQGLCRHCGKRRAEAGKAFCEICRLDAKKFASRPEAKKVHVEYNRNYYNERREKYLCVRCGKPLAEAEIGVNTSCERCREVNREYRKRIHGIKRKW